MHLKRLELSGFKSFAKTTVLEFPSRVTAVVGPNGSGKSNIKEAIQWVLGEQSVKALRGKKGEDLIWNGSASMPHGRSQAAFSDSHDIGMVTNRSGNSSGVPRMGRASVTLTFDNEDGKIPIDFDEVCISRKIFRDGLNEYYINDSHVRLKDVVEIMARIGLGESKHNIIGQGEVDRILLSSSADRREMLEDALGLRVYAIKKNEALRKLDQTENNMRQVEILVREIFPHLKFLRSQSQKAEKRGVVEKELRDLQYIYLLREQKEVEQEKQRIDHETTPFIRKRHEIQQNVQRITGEINEHEKMLASVMVKTEEEKKFLEYEAKRRDSERELGRLEGRLESEKQKLSQPKIRIIDMRYIKSEIQEFLSEMRALLEDEERMDEARPQLIVLVEDLEHLLDTIERGTTEEQRQESEWAVVRSIEQAIASLQEKIRVSGADGAHLEATRIEQRDQYRSYQQKIKQMDVLLRASQEEEQVLSLTLQRYSFEQERVQAREQIYLREKQEVSAHLEELNKELRQQLQDDYAHIPPDEIKKKIERMRIKLEEIGSIDPDMIAEFQETEARYVFLTKELEDLTHASLSLKELVGELDGHVKKDFATGFAKIKKEFNDYFRIIFGGGKAALELVPLHTNRNEEDQGGLKELSDDQKNETGVDISVDLPRKRIRGLAMLSGGERALTSIALLFAITAVNPPPFLILDETDAALDEANSQRFGAIISELSKKTQLLVITHNRETMKSAGILYGVTMGEDGVSKMLSLRIDQAEAYTNR